MNTANIFADDIGKLRKTKEDKAMDIFFIVGTGRCGTTLLAQMLNAHPDVCIPPELQILFEHSGNGARLYEIFSSGLNKKYSADDFYRLIEKRCPYKLDLYFDYRTFLEEQKYPLSDLQSFVNNLYQAIALSKGATLFAEQTPWYGQRIDILNQLFPNAKYIHMVRDGRDVAISFARTPWWHKDVNKNLTRWAQEVNVIRTAQSLNLKNPGQMLQIRYEDLVLEPESQLRKICQHLSLEVDPSMLDPDSYLDYFQYSKIDMPKISSNDLNAWQNNKGVATFLGSRFAWKTARKFDFSRMPRSVADTLETLGYER